MKQGSETTTQEDSVAAESADRFSVHHSYDHQAMCTRTYSHDDDASSDAAELIYESLCDVVGYHVMTIEGEDLLKVPASVRYAVVEDDGDGNPFVIMANRQTFTAKMSAYIRKAMHSDGIHVCTIGKAYIRAIDHAHTEA